MRTGRDVFCETNPIFKQRNDRYQNMLKTPLTEIELAATFLRNEPIALFERSQRFSGKLEPARLLAVLFARN